ncbi:retrovirus-related Pol polyprotein from transposon TNT 1-94 [Trichonephila clavipes]|nr:retrovirus-related Pol polyprotein from transposon TNT 1-94 [Trichonephila clavipes]
MSFGSKETRLKHLRIIDLHAMLMFQLRREGMDNKAIQGYLVGYDGDERYRIWLKKEHRVILSRDVIFKKKQGTQTEESRESEMNSLRINHTWELSDLPVGAKAMPLQRQGIDYSETYSPVAKLGTIRTVLSIVAEERMHLTQFDVSTAFPLWRSQEETIFMKQSEGFKDGSKEA